jgi:hypothetical protein
MRVISILAAILLAGCASAASKPVPVPPLQAEAPKPAPVTPAKPVSLDLTKFKALSENGELFGYNDGDGKLFYYTAGTIELPAKVPADGEYEIVVKASCDEAQGQKAKWTFAVDGEKVGGERACTAVEEKDYAFKASLKAGDRKIGIAFLNDLFKEGEYDLNFYIHGVTLKPAP